MAKIKLGTIPLELLLKHKISIGDIEIQKIEKLVIQ